MIVVVALGIASTVGLLIAPWALHRRTDAFRWQTLFAWKNNVWAWWAQASIVSFAIVIIAGRAFGVPGAVAYLVLFHGAFTYRWHRRYRDPRALERLCAALDGAHAGDALRALDKVLAAHRRDAEEGTTGYDAWAQWHLRVAAKAALAGHAVDAARWAEAIDPKRLGRAGRCAYAQAGAAFRLGLGDRAGARALLASAPRPADSLGMEQALQAFDALLDVLGDGSPAALLGRADEALTGSLHAVARMTWQATRVHALEASGAQAQAREALLALQQQHGDMPLKRIAHHGGPASPVAAVLLIPSTPYR